MHFEICCPLIRSCVAHFRALVHGSLMTEATRPFFAAWQGQLQLGDRWAMWRGDIGDGTVHRHFAAQAIIADHPVRVFDAHGRYVEAECVLIDPLASHRIESGRKALLIYVEPGERIEPDAEELLRPARAASSLAMLGSPEVGRFWAAWIASPPRTSNVIDARLAAALEHIEGALAFGPVALQAAAARSGLSPDRFRHLFAEQVGLPYKRYVLWRRLRLATTELMAGHDVTTSAHAAGFSDAAHFARTLKSTFGVTASQALTGR